MANNINPDKVYKEFGVKTGEDTSEFFEIGADARNIFIQNAEHTRYGDVDGVVDLQTKLDNFNKSVRNIGSGNAANNYATAFGYRTSAEGEASHAEGAYSAPVGGVTILTQAKGAASHAEGRGTVSNGEAAHSEGYLTQVGSAATLYNYNIAPQGAAGAHAEGLMTIATNLAAHAEGIKTQAKSPASHTEGEETIVTARGGHAEGWKSVVSGQYAHTEGYSTVAQGAYSHAEGYQTTAEGDSSHVEGKDNQGQGTAIHVEGQENIVKVNSAAVHIEGYGHVADLQPYGLSFTRTYSLSSLNLRETISLDQGKIFFDESQPYYYQLSEVWLDVESDYLFLQGEVFGSYGLKIQTIYETSSNSLFFQSPPDTQAYLNAFSVSKAFTKPAGNALTKGAHVQGRWSKIDNYAHIVGNGISDTNRKNIHTIDWDGNAEFAGDITLFGCGGSNPIQLSALTKGPLVIQESMIEEYSGQGEYGDKILDAIQKNRQILILLTNQGGSPYSLYSPVITYHLPHEANTELSLFYLPDGISPTNLNIKEAQFKVNNPITFNDNLKN